MADSEWWRRRWELALALFGLVGCFIAMMVRESRVEIGWAWAQQAVHDHLADVASVAVLTQVCLLIGNAIWSGYRMSHRGPPPQWLASSWWGMFAPALAVMAGIANELYQRSGRPLFGVPWLGSVYDSGDLKAVVLGGLVSVVMVARGIQARQRSPQPMGRAASRAVAMGVLMAAVFASTGASAQKYGDSTNHFHRTGNNAPNRPGNWCTDGNGNWWQC